MAHSPRSRQSRRQDEPAARVPPYSVEAEKAVLGSILLQPERTFGHLAGVHCSPEWFYIKANRTIYETAKALYDRQGTGVDAVTVVQALEEAGLLDEVGGAAAVEALVEAPLVVAHAEYYAETLRDKCVLRRIIDAAGDAAAKCYAPDRATNQILSETQESFFAIAERDDRKMPDWNDSLNATFAKIEDMFRNTTGLNGLSTGFKDLDKVIQGLRPSEMIVLAARPSMGKTSLAMNICTSVALDVDCDGKPHRSSDPSRPAGSNRVPVGVFSCEMSTDALVSRMLCTVSRVSWTDVISARSKSESQRRDMTRRLTQAMSALTDAPIHIDDTGGLDISDLRSRARRMKKRHGVGLILIDYLQLLGCHEAAAEGRQQETTRISAGIKAMAKELDIPVIVLSQLSRAPEQRDKEAKPRMADLRDSGSIEQDADVVMLLRRPSRIAGSKDRDQENLAYVDVAKNRNGGVDEVRLSFDARITRFGNFVALGDDDNPFNH